MAAPVAPQRRRIAAHELQITQEQRPQKNTAKKPQTNTV
jgi:hypothetical protein